jgi:hypothetical protein
LVATVAVTASVGEAPVKVVCAFATAADAEETI